MAKMTQRKTLPKRAKNKVTRRSGRLIIGILVILGILFLAELTSYLIGKAGTLKVLFVQKTLEFSGSDQPCGAFKAWDVLAAPDNRIVLTDQGNRRILIFDAAGKFLSEIGQKQAGDPVLNEISCLTIDSGENFYVIEPWNGLIRGFDPKGHLVVKLDLHSEGFYGPRGLAWDNGSFIVADTGSHRLVKLSGDGAVQAAWGKEGSGKDSFNNPCQVVSGQGRYYVVDRDNNRIQVLDTGGHFLKAISVGSNPQAEALDMSRQLLYVSSIEGKFVRAYNLDGKLMGNLVTGDPKNPNNINSVNALSVMPDGDIVAVSMDKVSVFHTLPVQPVQQ